MAVDVVAVLEALYRLGCSDDEWLHGILAAATPSLDGGSGLVGFVFDASNAKRFRILACAGTRTFGDPRLLEKQEPISRPRDRGHTTSRASRVAGVLERLRCRDVLGLRSIGSSGLGCCIAVPLARAQTLPRRDAVVWERIAAHVARALELRHDASPSARRRGRMLRRSPDDAAAIWRALASGRWSITDRFDSEDRRYLVAHKNDPEARRWDALTERERQVVALAAQGGSNKLIAFELGVSPSAIAMRLDRAMRKVDAQSRVELIAAYKRRATRASSEGR